MKILDSEIKELTEYELKIKMNKLYNTFRAGLLSLPLIAGCVVEDTLGNPSEKNVKLSEREYFDSWGAVGNLRGGVDSRTELRIADLDADGDLDIIASDSTGNIGIYENRIPQKNSDK